MHLDSEFYKSFELKRSVFDKENNLVSCHDPDIVVGTESWLHGKHLDSEYFPQSKGYTPFRHDRNSETKGAEFLY